MTKNKITDANGKEILPRMIVGMYDLDGPWSKYRGVLVTTDDTEENPDQSEDNEYCIAVFFNYEVPDHAFNYYSTLRENNRAWSKKYAGVCRDGEIDFLFMNEFWRHCPRIHSFRPDELIVVDHFTDMDFSTRYFGTMFHSVISYRDGLPSSPESYRCVLWECMSPATKKAFFNAWGTVGPLFVCDECFQKVHKKMGDMCPRIKSRLFDPAGNIINSTS